MRQPPPATHPPGPYFAACGRGLGGWPADYLCLDLETNGLARNHPSVLPVEIGWRRVEDRRTVATGSVLLDWSRPGTGVDPLDFSYRLASTREAMLARGHRYPYTDRLLAREGSDPIAALNVLWEMLADVAASAGAVVAGHNLWAFDLPLVTRCFGQFGLATVRMPASAVLDVGLVEAGRLAGIAPLSSPRADWYEGAKRAGTRVKWNLAACAATYDLKPDPKQLHAGEYDCELVHLLVEAMHDLADAGREVAAFESD